MKKLLLSTLAVGVIAPATAVELTWNFENGAPPNFFTKSDWGERDATFTYGPRAPFASGSQWVGFPIDDVAQYPGDRTATLTTAELDLSGQGFDALYVSWVHWGDIEGATSNFDGAQLQISTNGGSTWSGIDDPPEGGLNPAYDAVIVLGGGTPLSGKWAWCWDTEVSDGGLSAGRRGAPLPSYWIPGRDKPVQTAQPAAIGWRPVATGDLIAAGYATASDKVHLRWLFASDPLVGGHGYFIDDLRIADAPPPCEIPPAVSAGQLVDTPDTLSTHAVDAAVARVCADVDASTVTLHYTADGMADTASVVMDEVGGGDYTADIPAQPNDTDVWYWVSAEDIIGNRATTPAASFEVTDAITIAYDDGQPFSIDPTFFAAGDGIAARFDAHDSPDTTMTLYKAQYYFAGPGVFDIGVWDDDGSAGSPGTRVYSSGTTENDIDNAFWSWDMADAGLEFDSGKFYVGYTFVTGDSADNPAVSSDGALNVGGVQYAFASGVWSQLQPGGDMMLRVKVKKDGQPVGISGEGTPSTLPRTFQVHGNFPNPFNPLTVIRYDVPAGDDALAVTVQVFDLAGRVVARLVDETQAPGTHSVRWNGRSDAGETVTSGVYLYRIEVGDNVETRKMVILK